MSPTKEVESKFCGDHDIPEGIIATNNIDSELSNNSFSFSTEICTKYGKQQKYGWKVGGGKPSLHYNSQRLKQLVSLDWRILRVPSGCDYTQILVNRK